MTELVIDANFDRLAENKIFNGLSMIRLKNRILSINTDNSNEFLSVGYNYIKDGESE